MDHYRKERSTKQHLKIDLQNSSGSQEREHDGLLLANPMASLDSSPGPGGAHKVTSPRNDIHFSLHNSVSPPAVTELSQNSNHSRSSSMELSTSVGLTRAGSTERASVRDKGKSRPKSPSFFRFLKTHNISGSASLTNSPNAGHSDRKVFKRHSANIDHCEDEIDFGGDASSNSDHEDPFSPKGITGSGDLIANRHATESPKSTSSSVEQNTSLPRQQKRHARSSSSGSGQYTCRDSGFSSERESVSHAREEIFEDARCSLSPGPLIEEYQSAGMNALESLHNQLQILVKQNSSSEESDSVAVYEEVIASLSSQLEEASNTVDRLRQSDQTIRLSLRLAEQKTLEAETKLIHTVDRCHRSGARYAKLHSKYQNLSKKHKEMEKLYQRHAILHNIERTSLKNSSPKGPKLPVQRVHSQTQYDRSRPRPDSAPSTGSRPNTAQGFNDDDQPSRKISSMSHTETCV